MSITSGNSRLFLVEHYLPGYALDEIGTLAGRAVSVARAQGVSHHWSLVCPDEAAGFSLFEGPARLPVADIHRRAGFPVSRITPAVLLDLTPSEPAERRV